MNKYTYTNEQKEKIGELVIDIAKNITGVNWHWGGGYVASEDNMYSINIYDYMDEYTAKLELGKNILKNMLNY